MKEGNHCGLFFSYLLIFVRGWGALVNGFRLFICGGMIRVNTETYSHLPSSHKRTGSHTESYSYEYSYTFPWWRIRYSVISSRGYTPPALLASLKYAHPPCVLSLLALLRLTYFFTYSPLPSLFRFDLEIVCFILSSSGGYCAVSSVSVSAATRLA